MWTRSLLKQNAKDALRGRYWPAFAVTLIYILCSGFQIVTVTRRQIHMGHGYAVRVSWPLLGGWSILGWIFNIFFVSVLTVGVMRFFMENRQGNAPVSSVFSTFQQNGYWNLVKIMFLKYLFIVLWSLLFIIPGIIKFYEYDMVENIAAENPYLPSSRVFELSRAMTNGEKWKLFVLDLSFLGWYLLSAVTFGIGLLFVMPYYQATHAEAYAALRAKVFFQGITGDEELSGFVRY